jgi:hypothetical protein
MELLNQNIEISLNSVVFIFLLLLFILLSIFFVIRIIKNRRSVTERTTSNSGFLGRSLYSLILLAFLSLGIVFGVMAINSKDIFNIEATRDINADIYTNVLLIDGNNIYVDFKLVPSIGNNIWGEDGDEFDIYWSFVRKDGLNYSFIENDRSKEQKSSIQKYFPSGIYDITVTVVFEADSFTFTKEVRF